MTYSIFADTYTLLAPSVKQPVRILSIERQPGLGTVTVRHIGRPGDVPARTYHHHNTLQVIIIRRGWVEGIIGTFIGCLQQGTIFVVGNDVPHSLLRASDHCTALVVHIPDELLHYDKQHFPELQDGLEFLQRSQGGLRYDNPTLADRLARLAGRIDRAGGFHRLSLLMSLLHSLSVEPSAAALQTQPQALPQPPVDETPVEKACRYIYSHFRTPLTLADVAAAAGLHPTALCRAFRKTHGTTISHLCTRLRLQYACHLLLTTTANVEQIAYSAGYNSYPHFCTQFRKAFRQTPSAWRLAAL